MTDTLPVPELGLPITGCEVLGRLSLHLQTTFNACGVDFCDKRVAEATYEAVLCRSLEQDGFHVSRQMTIKRTIRIDGAGIIKVPIARTDVMFGLDDNTIALLELKAEEEIKFNHLDQACWYARILNDLACNPNYQNRSIAALVVNFSSIGVRWYWANRTAEDRCCRNVAED